MKIATYNVILNYYRGFHEYRLDIKRTTKGSQSAATCSSWFLARGFLYPEDGGDTYLRNVGSHTIYTAPHSRRRHSS
jgi:hypothetical protein